MRESKSTKNPVPKTSDFILHIAFLIFSTSSYITNLLELGIIDEEIPEPLGGAHTDYEVTAKSMKDSILRALSTLSKMTADELRIQRYEVCT